MSSPILGNTAKTSFERCLGTISGGWLGFGCALALSGQGVSIWLVPLISLALTFCSALMGVWLKLVYSSKLFALTFVLGVHQIRPKPSANAMLHPLVGSVNLACVLP